MKKIFYLALFLFLLTVIFFLLQQNTIVESSILNTVLINDSTKEYYIKNEYLLLLSNNTKNIEDLLREFDLSLIAPLGEWLYVKKNGIYEQKIVLLNTQEAQMDQEWVLKLEAHPNIHSASLNYLQYQEDACAFCHGAISNSSLPSDPLFDLQWHLNKAQGIDAVSAWNITKGNKKTVLAIVDRNFSFEGKDFSMDYCPTRRYFYKNILDYFNQGTIIKDSTPHGLEILSVLGSCTNNDIGLSAIDWHTQIFAVDSKSDKSLSARMLGVLWAAGIDVCSSSLAQCPKNSSWQINRHPANIINASFGFSGKFLDDPPFGPILDIIAQVNNAGIIIVSSSGNEGILADTRLPGSAAGVISVGASNKFKKSAYFSNFGHSVDVLAPGQDIIGLNESLELTKLNGTSFAAPITSSVASLLLDINKNFSWKHIEYLLKASAEKISCDDYCPTTMKNFNRESCMQTCCVNGKNICASGIINAFEAVKLAQVAKFEQVLLDVDDYFIALDQKNNFQTKIIVKNWGLKSGLVKYRSHNKNIKVYPSEFYIDQAKSLESPSSKEITIYIDSLVSKPQKIELIFESEQDSIETVVSLEPI